MKTTLYSLALAAVTCGLAGAQATTAYTTPVGYVSQTCKAASDTIVGVPLKAPTVAAAALSANPSISGSSAVLTVSTASFGSYANTSYVKFTSGPASGRVYAITANDATTITIALAGDTLSAVSGNTFSVTPFTTLNSLFPPSATTNSPLTTGNAFVNSATTAAGQRRTQLLLANTTSANINLAPSATYFILAAQVGPPATPAQWRRVGDATLSDVGGLQLWPDAMFTIRNPAAVTSDTVYTSVGEVETANQVVPLFTRDGTNVLRDNPRAITRPVDVTLNALNLGGTSAFVTSATTAAGARRDTLLVFNNTATGLNKAPSATYFYLAAQAGPPAIPAQWRRVGDATLSDVGSNIIPAGSAFIIRKYGTAGGVTSSWNNTPSY